MNEVEPLSITERLKDSDLILNAVDKAVDAAPRRHKLLGESIVAWADGKVKILPPK